MSYTRKNVFNDGDQLRINNLQRTNSLDDLHVFDNRFTSFNQGGHSTTLTSTIMDINDSANANWIMPVTATLLSVASSEPDDGVGGDGIRSIAILGLDQNLDEITDVVVLNGQTPVLSNLAFRAMNLSVALSGGIPGSGAIGIITISSDDDAQVFGKYVTDDSTCETGRYTVPRNKRFLLQRTLFITGAGADIIAVLEITTLGAFPIKLGEVYLGEGSGVNIPLLPIFLESGTTMKFRGQTVSGSPATRKITTPFAGLLAEIGAWSSLQIP